MKSSPDSGDPLGEFALTPADTDAMRRSAAGAKSQSGEEYLRFLDQASAGVAPSRATSAGWLPFALPDGEPSAP